MFQIMSNNLYGRLHGNDGFIAEYGALLTYK